MYHNLITRKPSEPADVTIQKSLLSQSEITVEKCSNSLTVRLFPIFLQFLSYLPDFGGGTNIFRKMLRLYSFLFQKSAISIMLMKTKQ
jgi:hypothetical protein